MEKEKEEKIIEQEEYDPNEKQKEVINRVFDRFTSMKEERDKARREFDGRTLKEYVNDGVDAYNGIVPEEIKETKEAWQSLIFDQKTRGKVKAIVALVTAGRPFINLMGKTEADNKFAEDMRLVFEDTHRMENSSYKTYKQILSACVKGTVIVEEGYQEIKKKVKEITSIDQMTGKAKFREKEVIEGGAGSVYSKIVPLLNFYMNENCAELKHDCIVMSYPKKEVFEKTYGKYEEAKYVKPGITYDDIDGIEYKSVAMNTHDNIEVMKYYNEDTDEFVILANGVWLNPQDKDQVCPLPFNHKQLPFVKTVFELADEEVPYGKHLPDIMAGDQETINALLRMTVDQEVLSIHKPILLGQGAELESYQMFPGKTFRVNGEIDQVRELDISGTQNSTFQILEWLDKKSDVNTAVDANTMGVHSGKKTAKEATLLDENSKRLAGTFQTFVYKLLWERALLRIENICQFYKQPIQYSVLKDKNGTPLENKNGKPIKAPQYREIATGELGGQPRWIKVKPEMCQAKYYVRLEEDIEPSMTRQERLSQAMGLLEEAKANPLISADEATLEFIRALGKNPERFYIKPTPDDMEASVNGKIAGGEMPPQGGGMPPESMGGNNQPNQVPQQARAGSTSAAVVNEQ